MFARFIGFLQKLSKPWITACLFVLVVLLLAAFQFTGATLREYSRRHVSSGEGYGSLDALLTYTPDQARSMIDAYGADGRDFYIRGEIALDFVFPLAAALLCSLLLLSWGPSVLPDSAIVSKILRIAPLLPFITMVLDYLENLMVLWMLGTYSGHISNIAQVSSVVTTAKWGFYVLSLILVVVSLLFWGLPRLTALGSGFLGRRGSRE